MRIWQIFTRGSLAALFVAWAALGGGAGLALLPVMQGWVSPVIGIAVGAFVALLIAYLNVATERDAHKARLDALAKSAPRFVFAGTRWTPLYVKGQLHYHALQLWLKNSPESRTTNSLAKNVSATIRFSDQRVGHPPDQQQELFVIRSTWLDALHPDLASFDQQRAFVDVPANDVPIKLMLAIRHPGEAACYAHSFGALLGHPDGRDPRYRLEPGHYPVRLHLEGDNVEQDLRFSLWNPGADQELTISSSQ